MLKLREKTLIDRFKGQIAWLELQKQRLKEKKLTVEISTVKKKQRALLLRLERERKEIHRLVYFYLSFSSVILYFVTTIYLLFVKNDFFSVR